MKNNHDQAQPRITEVDFNSIRPGNALEVGYNLWTVLRSINIFGTCNKLVTVISPSGEVICLAWQDGKICNVSSGQNCDIPELNAPGVCVRESGLAMMV